VKDDRSHHVHQKSNKFKCDLRALGQEFGVWGLGDQGVGCGGHGPRARDSGFGIRVQGF
jgi:hypothetical protein